MRLALWLFLAAGLVSGIAAISWWVPAYRELATQPAIVVVPQLILAALLGGFGAVVGCLSAAGMAICAALDGRRQP